MPADKIPAQNQPVADPPLYVTAANEAQNTLENRVKGDVPMGNKLAVWMLTLCIGVVGIVSTVISAHEADTRPHASTIS
jgi:hypothetical protein